MRASGGHGTWRLDVVPSGRRPDYGEDARLSEAMQECEEVPMHGHSALPRRASRMELVSWWTMPNAGGASSSVPRARPAHGPRGHRPGAPGSLAAHASCPMPAGPSTTTSRPSPAAPRLPSPSAPRAQHPARPANSTLSGHWRPIPSAPAAKSMGLSPGCRPVARLRGPPYLRVFDSNRSEGRCPTRHEPRSRRPSSAWPSRAPHRRSRPGEPSRLTPR